MVLFNHSTRELTAKIVFYGPGLCGKTTNLKVLHEKLDRQSVGKLLSLSTAQDRTIYFDLLPVELGNIKGYTVRFQLCTVPGQVFYNETRKLVLKGVDGIVFVVDSQRPSLSQNLESFQNLKENLAELERPFEQIPLVIQYNKRDIANVLSIGELQESLGFRDYPFVETVASLGQGVVETFRLVSKLTFTDLMRRLQKPGGMDIAADLLFDKPRVPLPAPLPVPRPEPDSATVRVTGLVERLTPPPMPAVPMAPKPPKREDSAWLQLLGGKEEKKPPAPPTPGRDLLGMAVAASGRLETGHPKPQPPKTIDSPFDVSPSWPSSPGTDVFSPFARPPRPVPPAAPAAPSQPSQAPPPPPRPVFFMPPQPPPRTVAPVAPHPLPVPTAPVFVAPAPVPQMPPTAVAVPVPAVPATAPFPEVPAFELDAPEPAATIPAAPEPPVFEPGVVRHDLDLEVLPLPVAFPEPEPQASSEPLPLFEAQPEPQASSEPEAQPLLTAYPQSGPRPEVDTLPGLEAGPRPAAPFEAEPEPLTAAFPEPEITPTPPPPEPSDPAELEATTQQLSVVVPQAPLAPAFDFTGEIEPPAVMPPVVSVLPAQPADNAEVVELKRRLEELSARLDSLAPVAKLDSISEKLDSLASRVQEVEQEGGGLPARLGQLETHLEETAARLTTEAADRSDENARRVASLAASLGQLRDTLSDRLETEGQSVRQQIESLMAGREEDRGQLLASVRSFADEKLSAAPVVSPRALDDLRTELSGQLSMLRSDLESLASALAVPTDGIHGLKVALKTTQEELAALAATVAKEAGEKATLQKSLDEGIEQRFEAFRTVQDEHFLGLRTRLDDLATALQQETLALTSAASASEDATGRRFEALEQTTTELMTVDSVTALLSQKLQGLRADIASHLTDLQKSNAEAMEAVRKDVRNGLAQAAAAEGRSRQLLLTLRQALEPFEKLSSSTGKENADPPASPDAP